nr:MAG TPA: AAA domain protein [Caudoviricetes sp.]
MDIDEIIETTREAMAVLRPLYDAASDGEIHGSFLKGAILDAMVQLTVIIDEAEDLE